MPDIQEFIDRNRDLNNYQEFVVTPDDHLKVIKKGETKDQDSKNIADVKVVQAVSKYFKKNQTSLSKSELTKIKQFSENLKREKALKCKSLGILNVVRDFFSSCQNLLLVHRFNTSNGMLKKMIGEVDKELKKMDEAEAKRYEETDLTSALYRNDQRRVRELLNLPEEELAEAFKKLHNTPYKQNALYLIVLLSSHKTNSSFRYWDVTVKEILDTNKKLGDKGFPIDVKLSLVETTPLHLASGRSNLEAVELLLEYGASPLTKDAKGLTALHHATQSKETKNLETIQLLLANGADPSLIDNDGHTAAYYWDQQKSNLSPEDYEKGNKLLNP